MKSYPCSIRPGSGREALDDPDTIIPAAIAQAVVQPAGAALPELDRLGDHAVAAPVRRPGHLPVGVGGRELVQAALQRRTAVDRLALARGPGAQAAAERPALEVGVGLGRRDLLDAPFDADLALQLG